MILVRNYVIKTVIKLKALEYVSGSKTDPRIFPNVVSLLQGFFNMS